VGLIELLIVILLLAWAFGYFGRGRLYGGGGSGVARDGGSNLIHTLLVIVVILVILRLLRVL
jgi:hypothetical protein